MDQRSALLLGGGTYKGESGFGSQGRVRVW